MYARVKRRRKIHVRATRVTVGETRNVMKLIINIGSSRRVLSKMSALVYFRADR